MSAIKLPKVYKGPQKEHQGKYMVSWSQIETWRGKRGFNTGLPGSHEYMRKYFLGETYEDKGWGQYGSEMEAYITLWDKTEAALEVVKAQDESSYNDFKASLINFTSKEKEKLRTIKPLGHFQTEVVIDFGKFVLLGFMDDHTADYLHIRDYKSKSANTAKALSKDDNFQLDVYCLYCKKELGITPTRAEYLVVERFGGGPCMKGGGRKVLSVGDNIWSIDRRISPERLKLTEKIIIETVKDISDHWKTFQKFNK
jgi:hypothetical protein